MLLASRKNRLLFRNDVRLVSTLFPSVKRLVVEYNINPENVQSSGRKKRLLKGDVIKFIKDKNLTAQKKAIQWPKLSAERMFQRSLFSSH
jgi:pyruvate/2-oxoglutarate dehydrogenase complex dihydrolipoamide acyltransferase (E2) component